MVVVDTPGFFDTEAIREESKKKLVKQTKDTILDMKPGPHVFLIVMEPTRFTSQEVQCLEMIKKLFDGDIFKHVVVVFTSKKSLFSFSCVSYDWVHLLEADQLDDTTITEYLSEAPAELTSFLEQCGKRYVSINASPKELSERHTNRKEVMKLINDLIAQNNNSYFTSRLLAEVNKVLKMNKEGVGRFQQIKPRPNATTVELGSDAETMKEVESIIEHHISSVLEKK